MKLLTANGWYLSASENAVDQIVQIQYVQCRPISIDITLFTAFSRRSPAEYPVHRIIQVKNIGVDSVAVSIAPSANTAANVSNTVIIGVGLIGIEVIRTVVADITEAVAVHVTLVGICCHSTVVADISSAVTVSVFLQDIAEKGKVLYARSDRRMG